MHYIIHTIYKNLIIYILYYIIFYCSNLRKRYAIKIKECNLLYIDLKESKISLQNLEEEIERLKSLIELNSKFSVDARKTRALAYAEFQRRVFGKSLDSNELQSLLSGHSNNNEIRFLKLIFQ